jgi:RimJ/RimL family protein N-acetyltransferase
MGINVQLFDGEHIRLGAIDHEGDAEIESNWTHNADYLRLVSGEIARPHTPAQIKKKYEAIEKEMEEGKDLFYFTIRTRSDDRLIGFAKLSEVEWSNGSGNIQLGIGDAKNRRKGYGAEALKMLLRFAFSELNLHRLAAEIPEYNAGAIRFFEMHGFVEEVRRRQALNRGGRRWDVIHLGLLRQEWEP